MIAANPEPDVKEYEQDISNVQSIEEAETDSLAGRESETYSNRIHACFTSWTTTPFIQISQSFGSVSR
jgi:hypothetical protein